MKIWEIWKMSRKRVPKIKEKATEKTYSNYCHSRDRSWNFNLLSQKSRRPRSLENVDGNYNRNQAFEKAKGCGVCWRRRGLQTKGWRGYRNRVPDLYLVTMLWNSSFSKTARSNTNLNLYYPNTFRLYRISWQDRRMFSFRVHPNVLYTACILFKN